MSSDEHSVPEEEGAGASSSAPLPFVEEPAPSLPEPTVGAPVWVPLELVDDDASFRLRPAGDLSLLATDLARLGQLTAVELRARGERFQIVSGFRRVEALRFLQRDQVLARIHTQLGDEDALLLALAEGLHSLPLSNDEVVALRERLQLEGRLTGPARDMLDKRISGLDDLSPETVAEEQAEQEERQERQEQQEVDADELADDVTMRLGQVNQDLSLLMDVFDSLDAEKREELVRQLRYSAELVAFLEGR